MEQAYRLHGDVLAERGLSVDKHGSVARASVSGTRRNAVNGRMNDDDDDEMVKGEMRREEDSHHHEVV